MISAPGARKAQGNIWFSGGAPGWWLPLAPS